MKINATIKRRAGVSTMEYAILIAVVAIALVGASVVLKRGICGNWKQAADVFGYGRISQ